MSAKLYLVKCTNQSFIQVKSLTDKDNSFCRDNRASFGAGMVLKDDTTMVNTDCVFEGNIGE